VPPRSFLVLVVDDDRDSRELYSRGLALYGFRVEEVRDGFEALERARSAKPDVIVMDLALPGMDGCETTRRLKMEPLTRDIPVIAVTGQSAFGGAADLARRAGCRLFLTKPVLPEDLANEIRGILGAGSSTET
jgi:CheY-like chemotaxis protein